MEKTQFIWSGFEPLGRIFLVGTLAYISLIIILKLSGNRALVSMNAFDFIITVTIGAVFGRVLTAQGVALSEAVAAFILLALLQYLVSFLETRSRFFKKVVTSHPSLLYYNGSFIRNSLKKEKILEEEVLVAARKKGYSNLAQIEAIILEIDGSFSVIEKSKFKLNSTYKQLAKKNTSG